MLSTSLPDEGGTIHPITPIYASICTVTHGLSESLSAGRTTPVVADAMRYHYQEQQYRHCCHTSRTASKGHPSFLTFYGYPALFAALNAGYLAAGNWFNSGCPRVHRGAASSREAIQFRGSHCGGCHSRCLGLGIVCHHSHSRPCTNT
ncbi:hypothetical protein GQ53DRAFT_231595 [Thozetella sp. PMI_491]|nr:hypothetical protein GQ53DRAFT_231595 [Thozetella sp. PMI_491]